MNYIKTLEILGKLVKSGQIKSVDEAMGMLQKMGAQVDGLLKQGIENLFKTTKARDPDAFKGWTPEVIEGGKGKEGVENLFKETKRVNIPADKLNHQIIADQAGIDVELIKGKDWVEILEVLKGLQKADGGRIGYDIGGLTGQAKNIYDSWISAGHSSEDALDYLSSRGMYDAGGGGGGVESIINTQQSIVPQGGGGGIGGLDLTYTPGAVAKTPPMGVDPSTVNVQEIDDYGTYAPRTGVMGMWDKTKDFFSNLGTPRVRGTLGTRMANQPSIPLPGALAAYSFSPFNEKSRNYNPNLVDQLNYLEMQDGMIGRDQGSGLLKYGPESVLSGKNVVSLLGTNDYEKMLMDYISKMNSYENLTPKQKVKIEKAEQELTDHRNKAVRVNRQASGAPAYNPTGEGNQTPGIGWNETGGPVSNRTGRGRTDWADGGQVGLATMFTRRR